MRDSDGDKGTTFPCRRGRAKIKERGTAVIGRGDNEEVCQWSYGNLGPLIGTFCSGNNPGNRIGEVRSLIWMAIRRKRYYVPLWRYGADDADEIPNGV